MKAMLAMSERGILLINAETGEMQQGYTVSELLTFGVKEDNVLMVVGTALKHRRLLFQSDQVHTLKMLLQIYFKDSPAIISTAQ